MHSYKQIMMGAESAPISDNIRRTCLRLNCATVEPLDGVTASPFCFLSLSPTLSRPHTHTHTHSLSHWLHTLWYEETCNQKAFRRTNMKASRHSEKSSVARLLQWMTDVFLCSFVGCWGGECSHRAISDTEAEGREGSAKVPPHTCSFTVASVSWRNVFCLPSFLKKRQFSQSFDSLLFCANVFTVYVRLRKYLFIYPERPFLWAYIQQASCLWG